MPYDYECLECGWRGELRVPCEQRDKQTCPQCGDWMVRLSHFATIAVTIPPHMRAQYQDELRNMLPDNKEARAECLETVYANTGRRRQDLE